MLYTSRLRKVRIKLKMGMWMIIEMNKTMELVMIRGLNKLTQRGSGQ
jgi:hypothetical protein